MISQVDALATAIRDWMHDHNYGPCSGPGDDTCPNWDDAYELAHRIQDELARRDEASVVRLRPGEKRRKPVDPE